MPMGAYPGHYGILLVKFSCILIFVARLGDENWYRSKNHTYGICTTRTCTYVIIILFNVSYKIFHELNFRR